MLADDEGIVIDSLKMIIENNFKDNYVIEVAKTGRSVIELAENYRPDIAFMDIQMPGINGIDAMKEIKKNSPSTVFIVMSAYDKFDYAKEAINLGVMEYLHKPVNQKKIVETIEKAMHLIDEQRRKRSNDLRIKEKLEFIVPVIENGLVSAILLQENFSMDADKYKELLGIQDNYGYMIILEYGDSIEGRDLTNPVGASVKIQSMYSDIREILKEYFECAVGPIMTNKIVCFVPAKQQQGDYESRSEVIEYSREMIRKLTNRFELKCRLGIGSIMPLERLTESYRDAANALHNTDGSVAHCRDLPIFCSYEDDYPIDIEKRLFECVRSGKFAEADVEANLFFSWMARNYAQYESDIKLKVLEFVLSAEHIAYESGGMTYHFRARKDYLPEILEMNSLEEIKSWFVHNITQAARNVISKKHEYSNSVIGKAKDYINKNYRRDISLEDISREVDMSTYYFSKLFKEVVGSNFIEYVTNIRIEKAKELIFKGNLSMKEICGEIGYSDPNYFSRIFKKCVGVTPTDFREGH
jgi:two-component system response regulator YesN